ncbi:MAG: hypothetical protein HOP15_02770 [Planctomycetes bacterium]|nr:hypothetical protein [Planctomycetota bacterium]
MNPSPLRAWLHSLRVRGLLMETVVAVSLFAVVLLASMAMVESGRRFSSCTMQITTVEDLAQQMLFRMEHELASATGSAPKVSLPGPLAAGEAAGVQVSSTLGFPPRGTLVLARGTEREERIAYTGLSGGNRFTGLLRGQQCTIDGDHAGDDGRDHLWGGLAEPLANQEAPGAGDYDGIALEEGQPVFFRGDGTGFSYRVPVVGPSGANNPSAGHELFFGADVRGVGPTTHGWMALVFEPSGAYEEATTGDDINEDGDAEDVFDIGQLRRLTWDTRAPEALEELELGPASVLQERCNRGGDLDGDGFADPLFLWNPETHVLHVRLFLVGSARDDRPEVRKVESVMFLRNEPEL